VEGFDSFTIAVISAQHCADDPAAVNARGHE
jgi:hypothetical protein